MKREIYRSRRKRAGRARRGRLSAPGHVYDVQPIGVVRRRWPRAYDGPEPKPDGALPANRRGEDRDPAHRQRRYVRPRGALAGLRQNPLRNGLIGLAVAGTAAPIAVNRYQQGMRTDPSHESVASHGVVETGDSDDEALTRVWQDLEDADARAAADREAAITDNMRRYSEYGLKRELAEAIYDTAVENEIDPDVAFGLVRAESSFRNTSTSPVGAIGLTQLMPKTASWLQPGVTRSQLRDPTTNLTIGFKYLKQLIDKYDGNERLALVAYNRGPGTVDRDLKSGRNPDNGYADFVHGKADHGHKLYTSR